MIFLIVIFYFHPKINPKNEVNGLSFHQRKPNEDTEGFLVVSLFTCGIMVTVGVGVIISVGVGINVGVGVKVGVGVIVGVRIDVGFGFGVGVAVGIRIGFGVGVDVGINIGLEVGVGLIIGQVQLGLYVPSQQICLPTLESQPQTPPCQEQHPCLAKIGEGNRKKVIKKITERKRK